MRRVNIVNNKWQIFTSECVYNTVYGTFQGKTIFSCLLRIMRHVLLLPMLKVVKTMNYRHGNIFSYNKYLFLSFYLSICRTSSTQTDTHIFMPWHFI